MMATARPSSTTATGSGGVASSTACGRCITPMKAVRGLACANWSQKQADWLHAHVKAFEFSGTVLELVVPDNLKSAVRKTHR